jgi:electron transfer flavoprotein alpha subunit
MSDILVWLEQQSGAVAPVSWEVLSAARNVAGQLGVGVVAAAFGPGAQQIAQPAIERGADTVFVCEDDSLSVYRAEPFADLLSKLARDHGVKAIMAGATSAGRDVLALAAVDLDAGLIPDCTALTVADGKLKATRPVYAGKLISHLTCDSEPVLMSLRSRAFAASEPDVSRSGNVVKVDPATNADAIRVQVLGLEAAAGEVSLTDAAIIVSGGRGVNGPEGFEPVRVLASAVGGALGASRAAVDAGWIPYAHQVGQTGKTVSPDLYIACGISGAIQHLAGMRTSKVIVAINKDAEAPIFKLAQYGIVGDLFKIVPALSAEFEKRLK